MESALLIYLYIDIIMYYYNSNNEKPFVFNAGVTIRESIHTYKDLRAASVQLVLTRAVINCALLHGSTVG